MSRRRSSVELNEKVQTPVRRSLRIARTHSDSPIPVSPGVKKPPIRQPTNRKLTLIFENDEKQATRAKIEEESNMEQRDPICTSTSGEAIAEPDKEENIESSLNSISESSNQIVQNKSSLSEQSSLTEKSTISHNDVNLEDNMKTPLNEIDKTLNEVEEIEHTDNNDKSDKSTSSSNEYPIEIMDNSSENSLEDIPVKSMLNDSQSAYPNKKENYLDDSKNDKFTKNDNVAETLMRSGIDVDPNSCLLKNSDQIQEEMNDRLSNILNSKSLECTDESSTTSEISNFLDDMAEEVNEEEALSTDENEIVEKGESIHSESDISKDEDDLDGSFICDEEVELLSGNEYDLEIPEEKPKRKRIIERSPSESEESVEKIQKKRKRIIDNGDMSSDETESVSNSLDKNSIEKHSVIEEPSTKPLEKNLKTNEPFCSTPKENSEEKHIQILENIVVKEPDQNFSGNLNASSMGPYHSIIIKEKVTDSPYVTVKDKVDKIIDLFMSSMTSPKDVNLSLSLKSKDEKNVIEEIVPIVNENKPHKSKKRNKKERPTQVEAEELTLQKVKKRKRQRKNKNKPKIIAKEELKFAVRNLTKDGFLTDLKNRKSRQIKPSIETNQNGWTVQDCDLKPSTVNVKLEDGDFKNKLLFDTSRNKREETRITLRKKGFFI